jgi:hypothetical protein
MTGWMDFRVGEEKGIMDGGQVFAIGLLIKMSYNTIFNMPHLLTILYILFYLP